MISPDIWQDPWFGKLSHIEQIFFIGIISNCDDEGRILGESPFLRSRIFVYQDVPLNTIEEMITKFDDTNKNFCLYSSNGSKYIVLKRWGRYQKPEHASPSILPPPPFSNDSPNGSPNGSTNISPNISGNDSPPSIGKVSIGKVSIGYIFSFWNSQKIIVHQKLTNSIEATIINALKNYTQEDICTAIKNYADILNDEQYYFKYSWTLKDFLVRGLEKFLNGEIARKNYLKDNNKDKQQPIKVEKTGKHEHMVVR